MCVILVKTAIQILPQARYTYACGSIYIVGTTEEAKLTNGGEIHI